MDHLFKKIIESLGEDVTREGLQNTPKRAAKALQFLTKGYHENVEEIVNGAIFTTQSDGLIVVKDIELYSLCEHHLLPFFGKCHVGYVPDGKILGLSKVARIVELYARRLQVQENLTQQIAQSISEVVSPKGVAVVIEAQHLCMMMRGVEKKNSTMKTYAAIGSLRQESARMEFLQLIS